MYELVPGVLPPLSVPYRGPFKVITRTEKTITILRDNGKEDTISLDRVKPANLLDEILND